MKTTIFLTLLIFTFSSAGFCQSDKNSIINEIKTKCEKAKNNLGSYTKTTKKIDGSNENIIAYFENDNLIAASKETIFPDYTQKLTYLYDNNKLIYVKKVDIINNTVTKKDVYEYFFNNGTLIHVYNKDNVINDNELDKYQKEIFVSAGDFIKLIGK